MDYTLILNHLLPNVEWSCGNGYESIVIHTQGIDMPTEQQCLDAWTQVQQKQELFLYQTAMQTNIDNAAISKGYNNGYACASYLNSTNQQWASESMSFIVWRDSCWEYVYNELAKYNSGAPQPTVESFIESAPLISWPS